MPIEKIANTDLSYYLVCYDKNGREQQDDGGLLSEQVCRAVQNDGVTDVFIISHGWKGDIPAAKDQYNRWMGAMAKCDADRKQIRELRKDFKALLVGFHWPSQPWGDEEVGVGTGASFAAPGGQAASLDEAIAHYVDLYADRIADTPAAREALTTIFKAAAQGTPPGGKLPPDVADAYRTLNSESGMGDGGPDSAPGDDREPFDPNKAFAHSKPVPGQAPSFGGGGLSSLLGPLRQLSFWQMKMRARTLGESAGFSLLSSAQKAVPAGRDVRFHLMGHSFGCIVMSGFLNGPDGNGTLPAPVHSLTLVQGATSLWGYCNANPPLTTGAGYFRGLVDQKKVAGAILTTQSKRDLAVGRFYPIAAGVAFQTNFGPGDKLPKYGGIGAFGLQGPGLTVHDLPIGDTSASYGFERGHIYNFECTNVIKDGDGSSGAHSDIAKPEVAHAMWEAVKVQ